jgi:hypothetical protein
VFLPCCQRIQNHRNNYVHNCLVTPSMTVF